MSTKCTIGHSKKHHLYEECFDNSNVYLRLDDDFTLKFSNGPTARSATVSIDIGLWRQIVKAWLSSEWSKDESRDYADVNLDLSWLEEMAKKKHAE